MSRSSYLAIDRRLQRLQQLLREDPLLTDRELSERLGVSVPTVRLDRTRLGIPELRERARRLARQVVCPRALYAEEVVGELLELELGRRGLSLLQTDERMAFARTGIVRGHFLFAQANSLAVACVDADTALTGSARLRFLRPVRVGQRVVARAELARGRQGKFLVAVESRVEGQPVLKGHIVVAALEGLSLDGEGGGAEALQGLEDRAATAPPLAPARDLPSGRVQAAGSSLRAWEAKEAGEG